MLGFQKKGLGKLGTQCKFSHDPKHVARAEETAAPAANPKTTPNPRTNAGSPATLAVIASSGRAASESDSENSDVEEVDSDASTDDDAAVIAKSRMQAKKHSWSKVCFAPGVRQVHRSRDRPAEMRGNRSTQLTQASPTMIMMTCWARKKALHGSCKDPRDGDSNDDNSIDFIGTSSSRRCLTAPMSKGWQSLAKIKFIIGSGSGCGQDLVLENKPQKHRNTIWNRSLMSKGNRPE